MLLRPITKPVVREALGVELKLRAELHLYSIWNSWLDDLMHTGFWDLPSVLESEFRNSAHCLFLTRIPLKAKTNFQVGLGFCPTTAVTRPNCY